MSRSRCAGCGRNADDGKLPAHVVTYLTLALCLFPDDDYTEVATKVTGSLDRWNCWNAEERRSVEPGPPAGSRPDSTILGALARWSTVPRPAGARCARTGTILGPRRILADAVTIAVPPEQVFRGLR